MHNFSDTNIQITYLTDDFVYPITSADEVSEVEDVHFVQAKTVGYQHNFIIPLVGRLINVPEISVLVPSEAMGFGLGAGTNPVSTCPPVP